jgi:hypothetical protein
VVVLAVRAFGFAGLAGSAGGGGAGWVVLVEEFLESGQSLCLEFDEIVEFLVVLHTDGIDEFCSGFENEIGRVGGERSDGIDMVSNTIAGHLHGECVRGSLGEFLHDEWAKFV